MLMMMKIAFKMFWLALHLVPILLVSASATDPEGLRWLAENAKRPGVKKSYSGYHYKLIQKGRGVVSPAGGRSRVKCHYEGRLIDGTVFDSTYATGQPFEFYPIRALDAWFPILMDMVVGDVYELYLPSERAVGDGGHADAKVPPDKAVIFKLELVEVVGKARSALKCDPVEPTKHCTEKEQEFIQNVIGESKDEWMDLKNSLVVHDEMDPEVEEWIYRQLHILELLLDPALKPRTMNILGKMKSSEVRKLSKKQKEEPEL